MKNNNQLTESQRVDLVEALSRMNDVRDLINKNHEEGQSDELDEIYFEAYSLKMKLHNLLNK